MGNLASLETDTGLWSTELPRSQVPAMLWGLICALPLDGPDVPWLGNDKGQEELAANSSSKDNVGGDFRWEDGVRTRGGTKLELFEASCRIRGDEVGRELGMVTCVPD